jgi:RimJ/RimL family protein N-acetyltransferase
MGTMTEIRTPRLLLRRWHDDDLAPLAEINADPQVTHWTDDATAHDPDHTAQAIQQWEQEWDEEGFGLFAVELLASGELAGYTGLSIPTHLPQLLPAIAISWRLGSPFRGQGYASEAAHATLEYALQDRGLDHIIAITRPGDDASENITRKLGMTPQTHTTHPTHGHPLHIHTINLTEYHT